MTIVVERPELVPAIHRVVAEAFGREDEARLVDRLRQDGDLVISLVALSADGMATGHIAFSRLKAPSRALALAPLAVVPGRQRQGIGSALVLRGLALARERGSAIVLVLGDPAYYGRLGFSVELAASFSSPYAGPHFMALPLDDEAILSGAVIHPGAFASLD